MRIIIGWQNRTYAWYELEFQVIESQVVREAERTDDDVHPLS